MRPYVVTLRIQQTKVGTHHVHLLNGRKNPCFYSPHRTAVAPQAAARFDLLALAVSHPSSVGGFLSWGMERKSLFCMARSGGSRTE